jgi:hypothetical protein
MGSTRPGGRPVPSSSGARPPGPTSPVSRPYALPRLTRHASVWEAGCERSASAPRMRPAPAGSTWQARGRGPPCSELSSCHCLRCWRPFRPPGSCGSWRARGAAAARPRLPRAAERESLPAGLDGEPLRPVRQPLRAEQYRQPVRPVRQPLQPLQRHQSVCVFSTPSCCRPLVW